MSSDAVASVVVGCASSRHHPPVELPVKCVGTLLHQLPQQQARVESRRVGPVHSAKPLQDSCDQLTAENCFKVGSTDGQPWQNSQTTEQSSGRVICDSRTFPLANMLHQQLLKIRHVVFVQTIDVGQAILLDATTTFDVVVNPRFNLVDLYTVDTTLCFQAMALAKLSGLNPPATGVVMARTGNRNMRRRPAQTRRSGEPTEQGRFQTDPA